MRAQRVLTMWVYGKPITQGSKTRGRFGMYDDNARTLKPWRDKVCLTAKHAVKRSRWQATATAVHVYVLFAFDRPATHYRKVVRNRTVVDRKLRDDAPPYPLTTKSSGDIDKLLRAIFDGLTAGGVWKDDVQVVSVSADKVWVGEPFAPQLTGARIRVAEVT